MEKILETGSRSLILDFGMNFKNVASYRSDNSGYFLIIVMLLTHWLIFNWMTCRYSVIVFRQTLAPQVKGINLLSTMSKFLK